MNDRATSASINWPCKITPDQLRSAIDIYIEEGECLIRVSRIENGTKRVTISGIGSEISADVPADFHILPDEAT